jgi:hypothetical protein
MLLSKRIVVAKYGLADLFGLGHWRGPSCSRYRGFGRAGAFRKVLTRIDRET